MLKMNLKYRKGTLILELKGELNKEEAYKLNDYLPAAILIHNIKKLVYDTSYLTYIDSIGLKVLKRGVYAVKENCGKIIFSKNSQIKNLIEG